MSENSNTQSSCEERKRLNQELSMLLDSKSAIREQVAGGIILKPAERRASLMQTNEMIDDVIALMSEHQNKHCSCEYLCIQPLRGVGTQDRRQKAMRRTPPTISSMVRG